MEADNVINSNEVLKCACCGEGGVIEWVCLYCDAQLHDRCITVHKDQDTTKTHSIIPNFDALTNISSKKSTTARSMAHKVKVTGSGIEDGVLSDFDSNFTVHTHGAGFGELAIRINGPKGDFGITMDRDRKDRFKINCKFDAHDIGKYVISVAWSNDEVPGSPFTVHIVETQSELEKLKINSMPEVESTKL